MFGGQGNSAQEGKSVSWRVVCLIKIILWNVVDSKVNQGCMLI